MKTFLENTSSQLERYLLLWLCGISLIALFWPSSVSDPFLASGPWINHAFAVTMFAIGWLLPKQEVLQVFRQWPLVLCGTTIQYISMPLIAIVVANSFGLNDELRWGIIMAGCVPGAMASNVLTMMARGNVSYSLCLTTSATLLSPICVPVALNFALELPESIGLDTAEIVLQLCWTVVIPVISGFLMGLLADSINQDSRSWATPIGKIIANGVILWIIAFVVGSNRGRILDVTPVLLLALLSLNLGGYAVGQLGTWLFRLPPPMGRALTLEIGMQNAGLGVLLAISIFGETSQALIPTALYTFGCMFTGTILASWWAKKSP